MPKVIKMPDGTPVSFPDDMPDTMIRELIITKFPEAAEQLGPAPAAKRQLPPPSALESAYSAVEGVGQAAFDIGAVAGAGGRMLGQAIRGEKVDRPGQAVEAYRAERALRAERSPVASTAGYVGGSLTPGGLVAKGAARVPGLAMQAGQRVRNVARLSAVGSATAGAQAAAEGEDIAAGAGTGAVAGPLSAAAAKVGIAAYRGAKAVLGRPSAAVRALAKRIGETPDQLHAAMVGFRQATGRAPSMVEIVNAGSARNLAVLGNARSSAGQVFGENAGAITAARPTTMGREIGRGGIRTNISTEVRVQNENFNRAMRPIQDNLVDLPTRPSTAQNAAPGATELDLPPRLIRAIAEDVRLNADPAAAAALENGQVSLRTIDNVRQALNAQHRTNPGRNLNTIARQIQGIGAAAHPKYQAALDEFGTHARAITGFRRGQKALTPEEAGDIATVRDLATPEAAVGREAGVRMRLSNEARASEAGAVRTAQALSERGGEVQREARSALRPGKAASLQRLGEAETRGAENLAQVSTASKASVDELAQDIQAGLEAAVAATGTAPTGFKIHAARRIIEKLRVGPETARRIAEAASDPARLPQAIAALRRARLRDDEIRNILLPRISAAAGIAAGGAAQ